MKVITLILIGSFAVGGFAEAQTQGQPPPLPELPAPPSPPWGQKDPIPSACKEEAQRLCSGKQGQDAASCLQSNLDKLAGKCKPNASQKQP